MLPKSQRLNLKKDFKWVAAGKKLETPSFKLMFTFNQTNLPKIGIALNSSYFKKAVLRNRARRLTSQAVQQVYQNLPSGLNLVIMPKLGVLDQSVETLTQELKNVEHQFK